MATFAPPVAGRGTTARRASRTRVPEAISADTHSTPIAISHLQPHFSNTVVIGLVINKQAMHSFPDKKNPGCYRYKMTFTVRDTSTDYINVTCWGGEKFISDIHQLFKVYDIVEVQDCQVSSKPGGDIDEKWSPWTPSPFQLTVNETYSSVRIYNGINTGQYLSLAHVPLRPHSDYYMLNDILTHGQSLDGSHVNILAAIGSVGSPKQVTSKSGKPLTKCEVILFDEGCNHFSLLLWDTELINLAQTWVSKENIVFAVDVKVTFDSYKNTMTGICTSKTLITTNPDSSQAHCLYQYAQTAELDFGTFQEGNSKESIDIHAIQDVYTAEQLAQLKSSEEGDFKMHRPSLGIVYAYLTSLDIDQDPQTVVSSRCSVCKFRVSQENSRLCCNQSCSTIISGNFMTELVFDLFIALADHTGTVEGIRLNGPAAIDLLHTTPTDYLSTDEQQRINLKSTLLLEKYKIYFKCSSFGDNSRTYIHILNIEHASPKEVAIHL